MKKHILLFCVIFTLVQWSYNFGQQAKGNNPEFRAQRQTEWMKRQLELSENQIPKVEKINLKYARQVHEANEKHRGNSEDLRNTLRTIRNNKENELKQVLDENQFEEYLQKRNELKHKVKKRAKAKHKRKGKRKHEFEDDDSDDDQTDDIDDIDDDDDDTDNDEDDNGNNKGKKKGKHLRE